MSCKECSSSGFFPWGTVLQQWIVPMKVPLHGPHFLTENSFLTWDYTGWKFFMVCPPDPGWDPPWIAVWISAPVWTFMIWSSLCCWGNCSSSWSTSSPSFFPDIGVYRAHTYSPSCLLAVAQQLTFLKVFLSFLKCVSTEEPPLLLMGSALGSGRSDIAV